MTLEYVRGTGSNKLGLSVFFKIKIITMYVAIKIINLDFRKLILVIARITYRDKGIRMTEEERRVRVSTDCLEGISRETPHFWF